MRWVLLIWLCLAPIATLANEEDKGRLTRLLENSLSGAGRDIDIQGFKGALSSHATMQSLSISDSEGVWITLKGIELIWSRAALLQGRVEVEKLIAAEIRLDRPPVSEPSAPTPESGSFALPELPVSIDIGEISAAHVILGAPILGEETTLSVLGGMTLADGQGSTSLSVERTDGKTGHVKVNAEFSNSSRVLAIDLELDEEPGGIAARLLNLPGLPSVRLKVDGTGPLDSYVATVTLETDGIERLTGKVGTQLLAEMDDNAVAIGQSRVVGLDIAGDLAPLFAPQHQDFFGPSVSLTTIVRKTSDGKTRLDQLLVNTRSFRAAGEMTLADSGLPEFMAFDLELRDPSGDRVLLPGTKELSLADGALEMRYDAKSGDRWSLRGRLSEVSSSSLKIASLTLDGIGEIRHLETPDISADVSLRAVGIAAPDPENADVAQALGPTALLGTSFRWRGGEPLTIDSLFLETALSTITATGEVKGPAEALTISGNADADIADLAFLEPFFKRPLRGAITSNISGKISPLTGAFDLLLSGTGRNLLTGETTIDALTGEKSAVTLSMKRSGEGLVLRQLNLKTDALTVEATGDLRTGEGQLAFSAALDDVNRLTPDFSGPVAVKGRAFENAQGWQADLSGTAPGDTILTAGLTTPRGGRSVVDLNFQIGRMQTFFPILPGSVSIAAKAEKASDGWNIDVDGRGTTGITLAASGLLNEDLKTADLKLSGAIPMQLLNTFTKPVSLQGQAGFDLALNGPFALPSLSGTVQTTGARLSFPELKFALSDISARVGLQNSTADISANGNVVAGGSISVNGAVGLTAPFSAGLDVTLNNTKVLFEDFLESVLLGQIRIDGPLTGGALISGLIDLENTEINIAGSGLGGGENIPEISHRRESGAVFRTRQFAGAVKKSKGGSRTNAPPYGLDLTIRADNKVFVRGLGLDSEFEGQFVLGGTSQSVLTSGEFDLSRGRMAFLTKRLALTEGVVRLEGDFIPFIRMVAETSAGNISFEIVLEGRATAPDLQINSSPDMPDEEALSYILFGEDITNISAIQAAQLAGALASLRFQSGGGIIGSARRNIGLDNLNITTDETGTAGVSAGKHLNERLYTEIGIDSKGESSISLNFDVSPKVTITGRVESDSDSAIGLFYRKDY